MSPVLTRVLPNKRLKPAHFVKRPPHICDALAGFVALKAALRSKAQRVLDADNIALYVGRWSLRGTDPAGQPVVMSGESTDVLRRQRDGRWRIVLDNPWGGQILGSPEEAA